MPDDLLLSQPPFPLPAEGCACTRLSALADTQTSRPAPGPHAAAPGGEHVAPRRWVIAIPPGTPLLNLNDERSMHRMKRYRIVEGIKEAAGWVAKAQRIPRLEHVEAHGLLHVPDKRKRDPGNWMPTQKAAIDAIVRVGVLADDHAGILADLGIRLGEPGRVLAYSLVIVEVAA